MNIIKEFWWILKTKNNFWGAFLVLNFRIAHYFAFGWKRYLGLFFLIYYRIFIRHIVSFDVHEQATIGKFFCPWHCFGIAVNPKVIIGDYFVLRHNVTIGEKFGKCPIIGNNVDVFPNSSIIGEITIGDNSKIGIGSVVIKDVPPNYIAVGNPARVIQK